MGGGVTTSQCAILLGGAGTRLGALTRDTPKPLLPVGSRPFVDVLVGEALRRGFTDLVLLAGHNAHVVDDYARALAGRLPTDCRLTVSTEPEPLGTGGALTHAHDLLADRFLLLNGDTWFDFNWLDLIGLADDACAVAAREIPAADRYESLTLAGELVSGIVPRGTGGSPALINGGVYAMCKTDLADFSGRFSLEDDLLPRLVSQGRLRARRYEGFFLDIGIPETFASAQESIPRHQRRPALFLDRDGVLNHDAGYVGSAERFEWIDGAIEAVRLANDLGFYVFVVTNQAGVARGFYGEEDVVALHRWVSAQLRTAGAWVDDFRYCPHHPEGTIDAYRGAHPWRKPEPGMLLDLMDAWPVLREHSLLIGDQPSDLAAAEAADIRAERFTGGNLLDFARPLLTRMAMEPQCQGT